MSLPRTPFFDVLRSGAQNCHVLWVVREMVGPRLFYCFVHVSRTWRLFRGLFCSFGLILQAWWMIMAARGVRYLLQVHSKSQIAHTLYIMVDDGGCTWVRYLFQAHLRSQISHTLCIIVRYLSQAHLRSQISHTLHARFEKL